MYNLNFKLGAELGQSVSRLKQVSSSMTTLGRTTKQTSTGFGGFQQRLKLTNMRLSNINRDANRSAKSIRGLTKSFGGLNMAMGMAKYYFLANAMKMFINASLDAIETNNLFAVSMGGALDSANMFIDTMNRTFGLDSTNLKSAVGTFGLLSRSMGINNDNAEQLSTNMGKLGLDLSSLMNVPINQVMGDLRSGLLGQSETVYKYGIDVTEASLKTEALAQGISKSVRNMSQGEKMALRYSVMLKQTALAQGDFARTLESPANQARILQERMVTLSRSIGNMFIPVLTAVLPYLNGFVLALTRLADLLAKLFGFVMPTFEAPSLDTIKSGAEDAEDAVGGLSKAIKNLSSGMDELNVLDPSTGSGSGGAGVSAGDPNAFDFEGYDNLMDGVSSKADEISRSIQTMFTNIANSLKPITDALAPIGDKVGEGLLFLYNDVLVPLSAWAVNSLFPSVIQTIASIISAFDAILETTRPALDWLYNEFLKPLGELVLNGIVTSIDNLGIVFEKLGTFITDNNEYFENLFLILSYIIPPILAFTAGFLLAIPVLKVLAIVIGALTSPIGIVIAIIVALIAVGALVMTHWDTIGQFFSTLWENMRIAVTNATNAITDKITMFIVGAVLAWTNFKITLSNIVTEMWNKIKEFFRTSTDNIATTVATFIGTVLGVWVGFKTTLGIIVTTIWEKIKEVFGNISTTVSTIVTNIKNGVTEKFTAMKDAIATTVELIKTVIATKFEAIKTGISNTIENIKTNVATGFNMVKSIAINIFESVSSGISVIWEGIVGIVQGAIDRVLGFIGNVMTAVSNVISAVASIANVEVPTVSETTISGKTKVSTTKKYPKLARGGSLSSGDFFEAGEAGKAEAIGSFNNKTTVMPLENTDFVNAIYRAVLQGTIEAQGANEPVIENVLNLDGETIYRSQQKVSKNRGLDFGMGVFAK